MATPINIEKFHHDGRGPESRAIHCWPESAQITAIDYFNPEDDYSAANLKHVYFVGPQVVQITPKEVIGADQIPSESRGSGNAAMFDMGRTDWLESFAQRHLSNCRHFKLIFYDELIDVICEGVECRQGGFDASTE